jgi:hypothetical protein
MTVKDAVDLARRYITELLVHRDVSTTMIYMPVLNLGGRRACEAPPTGCSLMTLPARDVEAAVNARVLASEGSQDIWAEASQHVPQHYETWRLFQGHAWWTGRIYRTGRRHRRVQASSRSPHR